MSNNQILPIKSGHNFRELGGYPSKNGKKVRYHKILRSASLADLSNDDLNFLKDYGLKTIIDFRSKDEVEKAPDKVPEGVKYQYLPVLKFDETKSSVAPEAMYKKVQANPDGKSYMIQVYDNIICDPHAQQTYREFIDMLIESDTPNESVLFHCTAGKDRTGMGAVYLLKALDVDDDLIKQDYLLTQEASAQAVNKVIATLRANNDDEATINSTYDMLSVYPEYLQAAYEQMINTSGSVNQYLTEVLNLTPAKKAALQKIYLD